MFVIPCVCPKWFTSSQSSKVDIPLAPAVFLEAGSDYKHGPWSTIQNTVIYLVYHTRRISLALEIQNPPSVYEDGYCTWPIHHQESVKICKAKSLFASFYIVSNGRGVTRFLLFLVRLFVQKSPLRGDQFHCYRWWVARCKKRKVTWKEMNLAVFFRGTLTSHESGHWWFRI